MKTYITLVLLASLNSLWAQKPLDTIYANASHNVALFFTEPIKQGITGSDNFVFTYNREKEQYFGLLQAIPGTESNLLTVTKMGQVYAYILKYRDSLTKLNYFINKEESIGREKSITNKRDNLNDVKKHEVRKRFFEGHCKQLLKSKNMRLATKREKGLKLQLQNMDYKENLVYLVLEFTNRTTIDFEVDYLKAFIENGNKKLRASYQKVEQKILFEYGMPKIINSTSKTRFVLVFPKFVLGKTDLLSIELTEKKGNRRMEICF
ncbi:DUF4138 domain-containing protein [Tamlana fucoidanivorans]|uniref:DUF4138 domain-containing protein n=1 Tax=Allotamlana fucoidanivorans TaxID=2583814 RepID=A0A5C4SR05_9FLAO|nr:DUF4138 domain-containing protein [Tamlana fucoidanivorans]TNJ46067.1 DUF4138 domain-containing protein [Tamlana fucoidanivorans]